jgi:hypothetical protein
MVGPQPFQSGLAVKSASAGRAAQRPSVAQRAARDVLGDGAPFVAAEHEALIAHRPGGQRIDDRLRRAAAHRVEAGRARVVAVVAGETRMREHLRAGRRRRGRDAGRRRLGSGLPRGDSDETDGRECGRGQTSEGHAPGII